MKDLLKLNIVAVLNGYRNKGTLVVFDEKHEDGDFKGKPIVYFSNNTSFAVKSRNGWTYDKANNRVNAPVISEEDSEDRRLVKAKELGFVLTV